MSKLVRACLVATLTFASTLVMSVTTSPNASAAESRVVCNHPWVRVREAPSTDSRELGRLSRGTQLSGVQQGRWFRLADGRYVAAYYTCPSSGPARATAASGQSFTVCGTPWVRVREAATKRSRELGRLSRGDVFSGEREGGWIRTAAGYVSASYACTTQESSAAAAAVPDSGTALRQPTGTLGSPTGVYGNRWHPIQHVYRFHNGIDIGNTAGQPVVAAESGVVTTVASDASAGLYIKVDHGSLRGVSSVGTHYLHLEATAVSPGQRVERGQLIGWVGSTGSSTKPHLHYSVLENGTVVNPEGWVGSLSSLRP